ncbi:MARCO-like protein [Manis javanica]|nr:MARCO-like protein [Manis javanica]
MFLAIFSVSSTQPLKTSVFKLQEGPESALIVEGGNEANIQRGQKESTKPGGEPGLSRQQQRSRPFYSQQERKTVHKPLNHNLKEIQVE